MTRYLLTKLKNSLRWVHHKIPSGIQKIYMPFFWKITGQISPIPLTIFVGQDKNFNASFRIAYYGWGERNSKYWGELILAQGYATENSGRYWPWQIRAALEKLNCDMVLAETTSLTRLFLTRYPGLRLPHWMFISLDLKKLDANKLWRRRKADIERHIRKNKLSCMTAQCDKDFDDFFLNMYSPYASSRFGNVAKVFCREDRLKIWKKGELLLIKNGEDVTGGILCEFGKKEYRMRSLGVRDAKWEYVQSGVIGATYYFSILAARKMGYSSLYMGGTRIFLTDGVTQYKISFSGQINSKYTSYQVKLIFLKNSPALRKFSCNNPFIYSPGSKKPYRAVFWDPESPDDWDNTKKILDRTRNLRTHGTTVFAFTRDRNVLRNIKPELPGRVKIESAEKLFLN